jgi:hypothetical protein
MQPILVNYRIVLQAMKLTNDEIARRLKDAAETSGPLTPITPEVEGLLGPAQPVADVLEALNGQYKADGKPATTNHSGCSATIRTKRQQRSRPA